MCAPSSEWPLPEADVGLRALGLDLGTRRIGVALSNSAGTLATPYEVVQRSGDRRADHRRIAALADEAEVDMIVVGLPLHLDGRESPSSRAARAEARQLSATSGRVVETYDERLTTVTAERSLRMMNIRGNTRRKMVDQLAATVMLQSWLDHRRSAAESQSPPDPSPEPGLP